MRTALEHRHRGPRAAAPRRSSSSGTAYFRAGASLDALAAFRAAADVARELGDGELFARAAIGFEDACWRPGISDAGALELLEEASSELAPVDSPLRVRLLAGLARALDFQGDHARGAVVRESAVAMGRRLDDRHGARDDAHALVLVARRRRTLDEILAMLTEARDLAGELGDLELQAEAMEWRVAALMGLGEIDAARARARGRPRARQPDARSRSWCTWPSTTARRSRSCRGGSPRRRRPPSGRTSGAGC